MEKRLFSIWAALNFGIWICEAGVPIEPFDLLFREITMYFSFLNPFTHERAAEMIESGYINVAPLISRTMPISEAANAIANPPMPGEIRAIVIPG